MTWTTIDADVLTPAGCEAWRVGPRAGAADEGLVLTSASLVALVGPSAGVDSWLTERYGVDALLVRDLACFVYHRKGWFAPDLDALALRDRRAGQYELRVLTEVHDTVVPLFAMDLAPVRHRGTWATLDQRAPNPAASLVEIGVVPPDQPVVIAGQRRSLGDLACGTDRLWEAARLAAVGELVRASPRADEAGIEGFGRMARAIASLGASDAAAARAATGRALFGLALAWAFARLPVDVVVGLSRGNVVRAFTTMLAGRDGFCHPLTVGRWHAAAAAFRYAPGYFATGEVRGYSIDAVALQPALVTTALRRLARTESVPR